MLECCMHLTDEIQDPSKIIPFSLKSWRKFVTISLQWVGLETPQGESEIAERAVINYNFKEETELPEVPANVGYHRECYRLYTNVQRIQVARKRKEKKLQTVLEELGGWPKSDNSGDINIGSAFTRWSRLKEVKKLKSHAEVATLLLDRYDQTEALILTPVTTRRKGRLPSVPESQQDHQTWRECQVNLNRIDELSTIVPDNAYRGRRVKRKKDVMVKEGGQNIVSSDEEVEDAVGNDLSDGEGDDTTYKIHVLHSAPEGQDAQTGPSHFLPTECFICRQKPSSESDKLSRCTKTDHLILAAEKKSDEDLLVRLRGTDLETSEIRYHYRCYANYIQFLYKHICVICRKNENKKQKEMKTLTKPDKLILAAEKKNDEELLARIREKVSEASEIKHHRSCYSKYVHCLYPRKSQKKDPANITPGPLAGQEPETLPVRSIRKRVSNPSTSEAVWAEVEEDGVDDSEMASPGEDDSDWNKPVSDGDVSSGEDDWNRRVTKKKERPHHCEECNAAFTTQKALATHTRAHTGEKPHQCEVCQNTFSHRHQLLYHMWVHTGERPYQCNLCEKAFRVRSNLVEHRRIHTGEKPCVCEECGKAFRTSSRLAVHRKTHNSDNSGKQYQCSQCDRAFTHQSALNTHTRVHTGEKPYHCEVCDKAYKYKTSLVEHARIHTGEKPYICENCGKAFRQKATFQLHRKSHNSEKLHQCEECGKQFPFNFQLKQHCKNHTEEKPYQCQDCGKTFKQMFQLNHHMTIHTGVKPHQCDLCDKAFRVKANLVLHRRCHTGEKPFHCQCCKKCFRDRDQLNRHMTVHTGEKPFVCVQCGQAFRARYTLTVHKRKHTREIRPEPIQERNYITEEEVYYESHQIDLI